MSIADALLGEYEQEARITEKFLNQLPEDKLSWKPHEKSMSAGQLAFHIAAVPGNTLEMALKGEIRMSDVNPNPPQAESKQQILETHQASARSVREKLPTLSDEAMQQTWSLLGDDGQPLLQMPRGAFIRSIVLNHWIQHRGQFGVFLRLMGAKVPSSYGPSGDEPPEFLQ